MVIIIKLYTSSGSKIDLSPMLEYFSVWMPFKNTSQVQNYLRKKEKTEKEERTEGKKIGKRRRWKKERGKTWRMGRNTVKGMLYPRGNSELMCYKLPTIPWEIFWKFGLNSVPIIISSCNRIFTLKIDPINNHAKFHQVWFSTTVVISILRSRYL